MKDTAGSVKTGAKAFAKTDTQAQSQTHSTTQHNTTHNTSTHNKELSRSHQPLTDLDVLAILVGRFTSAKSSSSEPAATVTGRFLTGYTVRESEYEKMAPKRQRESKEYLKRAQCHLWRAAKE